MSTGRPKVLVKEKIAEAGVSLLADACEVEMGVDWSEDELSTRIGEFDGILIRSATTMDEDLISKGERLRVIGRAGTGVDNVDLDAATKRGIVVANAPEANSVAAAEHTMGLLLSLCRNIPAAHESLTSGKWERASFGGGELYGKTLGLFGFGRIGQLVAQRALGFEMKVIALDKFVAPERFKELGVEGVDDPAEIFGHADFISLHLPKTPETVGLIGADSLAEMRPGVRIVNCARGELVDLDALADAVDSGLVGGAALDVFPDEPFTEHRLFGMEGVVVTPHLGASTAEAQDRAGIVTAEQVLAALTGGVVTTAVNIAAVRPEEMEAIAPFVPLCERLGALAQKMGDGVPGDIRVEFKGRLAERDTRILALSVLAGALRGHTEENVNLVNAAQLGEARGIEVIETSDPVSEDFTELVTVSVGEGEDRVEVAGTGVGPRNVPYLVRVWGEDFYLPFADNLAIFRYTDQPGMIGLVGSEFGKRGVNIVSAAVGAEAEQAVMALTTDAPVSDDVIDEILKLEGFFAGHAVATA
jgi:D-3-phosphoglycerate dehydrogenase